MPPRRLLKIAGWTLAGLVAVPITAALLAWGAANTDSGRAWIADQLATALSTEDAPAEVAGLDGPLPQAPTLDRLVLRDAEGAWLTLENAELRWDPLALLSGRLQVQAVTAERVALDRLPQADAAAAAEPAAEEAPFELPDLPVAVRLETLRVDRLELGAPVLGQAAVFQIDGSAAAAEDRTFRSRLAINRLDGPQGRFTADTVYDAAARTLDLDAELEAAREGLVAELLGLPDAGASRVRLQGQGPLQTWTGTLTGQFGESASIDADLRLLDARRLEVAGTADVIRLLDEQTAGLIGGPLDFDLAVERAGQSGAKITRGRITTPTTELRLSGGLNETGESVDARIDFRVLDPTALNALAEPAAVEQLTATVTAKGPLDGPALHLTANAATVSAPEAELANVTVEAGYTPAGALTAGDLSARIRAGRANYAIPELQGYRGEPLQLELDGRLDHETLRLEQAQAELETTDLTLALDGSADLNSGSGDAAFTATFNDLARIDPVMDLGLTGQGTLTGHAQVGGNPLVRATVTGDLRQVGLNEEILQALLHDRVELASDLTLQSDGALSLSNVSLASPSAQASGSLDFPADFATLSGNLQATVPNMDVLSQSLGVPLAGTATAETQLGGPIADPGLESVTLEVTEAAIADQSLGQLSVAGTIRTLASGAQGRLDATAGSSPVGRLQAATDFALQDTAFTLANLSADAPGLELREGRLSVPLAGGPLQGHVELTSDDLGTPLEQLAGLQAVGRGQFILDLGAGAQGQQVTLDGALRAVELADGAVKAETVEISAQLDRAFASPTGRVRVTLDDAGTGPASFKTLSVTANGGLDRLDVKLRGDGDLFGPMTLAADSTVALTGDTQEIRLSRLQLDIGERQLRLGREAVLQQSDETLEVRDLVLEVGDGRLTLDARRDAQRIRLGLDARDLPLSYSGLVLANPKLDGTLDATARLEGPLDAPSGKLDIQLREVKSEGIDAPPLDGSITSTLKGGVYRIDGEIAGVTETAVELSGEIPVDVSFATMTFALDDQGPLQGKLSWSGEVAPLMPLVPTAGHRLTGKGDVSLTVDGRIGDPQLNGRLTLEQGLYENLETGTLLTDLALTIEATGERVEITHFEAKDGNGGTLDVRGGLDVAPEENFPLEVELQARNAKLVRLDYLDAIVDADQRLSGTLNDMLLEGTITVRRAEIRMPQSLPPEVAELNVVTEEELQTRRQAGANGETQPSQPESSVMRLDLTVDMPGQVFVRGNGLDSEWAGRLQITGTANQPTLRGQISVQRGRLTFLGKGFTLDEGVIAFDGGREIDPTVNVTAVNRGPELTAVVRVSGRVSNPDLELSSTPPLPRDEVLARLLFGKSASNLTPLEGAQLAAAVAELSISGGGPGLLDRLRGLVGVDVLRVGSSSTDDGDVNPTVEAGSYVTDEVFVGVEQGATSGSSKVKVEVDVTDNIIVESDVGVTGGSNVGVQFKWDY